MKAGELSLIEISDILSVKGEIKKRWTLRAEIAFNGHARELYTEHESLIKYLNTYLDERSQIGPKTNIGEYRYLKPDDKLFIDPGTGEAFKFSDCSCSVGRRTSIRPQIMIASILKRFSLKDARLK